MTNVPCGWERGAVNWEVIGSILVKPATRGFFGRGGIPRYDHPMIKGSREGVLRQIQPISIHGQISWNVYFNDPEDLNGPVEMERVGPESVMSGLEPGDLIRLEYLLGVLMNVTRAEG